jgi:hypothetical protein
MGVSKLERFFRAAAGLDVDRQDLKRFTEFLNQKIHDQLVRAEAVAKANARDIIEPHDLPVTKGLQECIHAFREIDRQVQLDPLLGKMAPLPPSDLAYSDATVERLPEIVGGLSMALARSFTILDPKKRNPGSEDWERIHQIFNTLL